MSKERDKFIEWMRTNTSLLESSIQLYARTVDKYLEDYGEITADNVNAFINETCRERNSFYIKYAFKYYLEYIGKKKLYVDIVKVKIRPRKKLGKYLSEELLKTLIESIEHPKYQDIAALQFATGARAREILTLREEHLDLDYEPDVMRIRLLGKGAKERIMFLHKDFRYILEKYLKGKAGYLFLADILIEDEESLYRVLNNERSYYYSALKMAAQSIGLDHFGTHDFRRNAADIFYRKYNQDVYTLQKILGHSLITTTAGYLKDNPQDLKEPIIRFQRGGV